MHNVGEKIVGHQPIVGADFFTVDLQRSGLDASRVLFRRMCPELSRKDVQNFLTDPSALGKRGEREEVGINSPKLSLGIKVVGRLVVTVVAKARAFRLQSFILHFGLLGDTGSNFGVVSLAFAVGGDVSDLVSVAPNSRDRSCGQTAFLKHPPLLIMDRFQLGPIRI